MKVKIDTWKFKSAATELDEITQGKSKIIQVDEKGLRLQEQTLEEDKSEGDWQNMQVMIGKTLSGCGGDLGNLGKKGNSGPPRFKKNAKALRG